MRSASGSGDRRRTAGSGGPTGTSRVLGGFLVLVSILALPAAAGAAKGPVVDEIRFSGNRSVPEDSLLSRMATAESGFLSSHRLDAFTLGQDLVNLEAYYQDIGFLAAAVRTGNLDYNRDSTHVNVHVKVTEGPRWLVDSLTFVGNARIPLKDLAQAVGFRAGDPFSPSRVLTGRDRLVDLYVDRSFLDAAVEGQSGRDDANHRAKVVYRIAEGGIAHVGPVRITGLVRTDTSVVRRELTLEEGNRLRVKDVARSQANLYTTGLFRSVYISPDTSSAGDSLKVVTVALVERRTGQLSFGVGYGTGDRVRLTTEVRHRNLMGQNLEAGFEGKLSRRRSEANVAFSQPWSFGTRFRINEKAGYSHVNEPTFTTDGVNFGGSILRPIFPFWRLEGGYDWSRNVILRGPDSLLVDGSRVSRVSRFFAQGTYETRDDLFNTYKGYYALLSVEGTGALLGGTTRFIRVNTDQRFFRKAGDFVFGIHMGTGLIRSQSAGIPVPVTERYFAGGQGTIRGFAEDHLGPKNDDGNAIGGLERVFVQAESRFPIFWILGGVVFVDAGAVADRPPGVGFGDTAAGAGLGLRVRSPIGIIRFDVAAPLTKTDAQGAQFTFGTSQEF